MEALLGSDGCDPVPDGLGHELKAVIRADISRNPPSVEKIPQDIDDIGGVEIAFHPDCQTLRGSSLMCLQMLLKDETGRAFCCLGRFY